MRFGKVLPRAKNMFEMIMGSLIVWILAGHTLVVEPALMVRRAKAR
jgi:hypothetical protein